MNQERPDLWLQNALVIHLHLRLTSLSSEWRSPREQSHCPSLHTAHSVNPALHENYARPAISHGPLVPEPSRDAVLQPFSQPPMEMSEWRVRRNELSRILWTRRTVRRCKNTALLQKGSGELLVLALALYKIEQRYGASRYRSAVRKYRNNSRISKYVSGLGRVPEFSYNGAVSIAMEGKYRCNNMGIFISHNVFEAPRICPKSKIILLQNN